MSDKTFMVGPKASVSSQTTWSDSKETLPSSSILQLKIAFSVSWCINLALCLLIAFVLITACFTPAACDRKTLVSFSIFVALFLLLTVSLVLYRITRSYVCFIMAGIFAFEQFICVTFAAFALFTNERSVPAVAFREDPLLWAHGHSAVALAFTVVFLPLFVIQLILLAKCAYEKNTNKAMTDRTTLQSPKQDPLAAYRGFYFPYC